MPLPDPTSMQPYHLVVDKNHNVWGNLWTNDQILKYDPASAKWTIFELPVRGTEIRHIALDERSGTTQGDPAGLPHQPDGRDDVAQRGRSGGAQGAGGAVAEVRSADFVRENAVLVPQLHLPLKGGAQAAFGRRSWRWERRCEASATARSAAVGSFAQTPSQPSPFQGEGAHRVRGAPLRHLPLEVIRHLRIAPCASAAK